MVMLYNTPIEAAANLPIVGNTAVSRLVCTPPTGKRRKANTVQKSPPPAPQHSEKIVDNCEK